MGNYASNQLSYRHTQRVVVGAAMEAGGCGDEFCEARRRCAGRKKKSEEVRRCMDATEALRQCMEGNESHFKSYTKAMDAGLDQDEGKKTRSKGGESEQERWRWRWWTGMIRIPPPPPPKNKDGF